MSDGPLLNDVTRAFAEAHRNEDVRDLALKTKRTADLDLPAALDQIAGWQIARNKLPQWAACADIVYPAHISMEQCSSQFTAQYKAEIARRLLRSLPQSAGQTANDATMTDPARRDEHGARTYAIEDCTPDVLALRDLLLAKARYVMIKLSPMLDWRKAVDDFAGTVAEVHIVSTGNECKELLLVLDGKAAGATSDAAAADTRAPHVYCVNDDQRLDYDAAAYTRGLRIGDAPLPHELRYLYEPNASIMKAGCFDVVEARFGAVQIGPSSHLFVSDEPVDGFPGRGFAIETIGGMGKKELKRLLSGLDRANIAVRNFPLTAPQLRKKLKLADGGDAYLFGTTMQGGDHVLIRTAKISR